MSVTHRVTLSADEEMLEELKALRNLGTSREKMLEIFGGNMLPRLEQLEARKALSAKVIMLKSLTRRPKRSQMNRTRKCLETNENG